MVTDTSAPAAGQPGTDWRPNRLGYRILGVIARGPNNGCGIVKALDKFRPVNLSQVYPILSDMEAEGLLVSQEVVQNGKPNRKDYALTPTGAKVLRDWVNSDSDDPVHHDEFVAKVFSSWQVSVADTRRMLQARLAWTEDEASYFRAHLDTLDAEMPDAATQPDRWQFTHACWVEGHRIRGEAVDTAPHSWMIGG